MRVGAGNVVEGTHMRVRGAGGGAGGGKGVPSTTFFISTRWFLIQIAYNIGHVAKTDKVAQTNGGTSLR